MNLIDFGKELLETKAPKGVPGHLRISPTLHQEANDLVSKTGDIKLIGKIGNINFYADPALSEGTARFINSDGRIFPLLPEEKECEQPRKNQKRKPGRPKTRTIPSGSPESD